MARRSKLAAWPGRLALGVLGAMLPALAAAQEPELGPSLADLAINGNWDALYFDQDLGPVEGHATVDDEAGSASVVFIHPQTGEEFGLTSTSLHRDGVKITIVFEGQSPVLFGNDGKGYPQRHLIVPEEGGQVVARIGANEARTKFSPRRDSDQETIELQLTIEDDSTLKGRWRYQADPFTRRARDGLGRVGEFVLDENGNGRQKGEESWRRPESVVLGAFTLDDQTGWHQIFDKPFFPHPYQNDRFQGEGALRTVFIFGTDLPDGRNRRAIITSEIDGISYGRVIYPDSTFKYTRGHLTPFKTGKAELLKFLQEREVPGSAAKASIEAFDYLVVEATLSEGIQPGLQPFTVNGSENTWLLKFGNNRADIRFIRQIDPEAIPGQKTDIFDYTIKHTDQKITKGNLTVAISDDAATGNGQYAVVMPGQSVSGDIYSTKTYTQLPDTIERFRRWGLFPRWDPKNVEESPIVTNPGVYAGRNGTLVLSKDGSFTYKANESRADIRADIQQYEATGDAFIPEAVQIEVRTELDLGVDVIRLTIGKNGKVQKMGSGPLVAARRTRGEPRTYRTAPIMLSGAGSDPGAVVTHGETPARPIAPLPDDIVASSINEILDIGLNTGYLVLPVQHDDVIHAAIAGPPGVISFMPPPAALTVHTTPARFPLGFSYLWKDHLQRAAACYPDLDDFDWKRSDNEFVAVVERDLNFEWSKLLSPILLAFPSDTLTVDFQLGDHAALLMMRQTFNQMTIQKMKELERAASSEAEIRAFWVMMSPYRWNPRIHPITDVRFDIQVTGPRGQKLPFLDTYWGEDGKARTYDNLDDMPTWIVRATREAIHAYIEILAGSLVYSEKIATCNVKGLVKLAGNTFDNVQKWLTPRLMLLESNSAAKSQRWVPHYRARLRVEGVASKFRQVRAYAKISDQDTQHLVLATAVISLPLMLVGGAPAAIILGVTGVGLEAVIELPKVLRSRSEIVFARGTVDVLGYGRHARAKASEYSFNKYFLKIAIAAATEVGGGPALEFAAKAIAAPIKFAQWAGRKGLKASAPVLEKSLISFRSGVRYVLSRRGESLFKLYDFDVSKVPSNLRQRDYNAIMEYVFEAGRLRAANGLLDDDQIKVIARLENIAAEATARPGWSRNLDEATHQQLKEFYHRDDIKSLMTSDSEIVAAALRAGGRTRDEALRIIRYSAVRTGKRFQDFLDNRLARITEPQGFDFYDMTAWRNIETRRLLHKNKWFISIAPKSGSKGSDLITIRDSAGKVDEMTRAFDPETGTLSLVVAYRNSIASHIKIGLPINLTDKGVPSFLFAQLRYMNRVGIGYAGQTGTALKRVVMDNITNARTIAQIAWFMKTNHPGKTLAELNESGVLGEFLMSSRSLEYARSVINMSGYRVKSVRLDLDGSYTGDLTHAMHGYKVGGYGESWDQFLRRHSLTNQDQGPALFDIVIEVEPHPRALGETAATGNRPPGHQTDKLPRTDTEPVRRTPTSNDDSGGAPPPGDEPPVGTAGGDDEPLYMARVARLRQQAEQQAQDALARYRAYGRGEVELTNDQLDQIFWTIRNRVEMQDGLEQAVSAARLDGLADDVIARQVTAYANAFDTQVRAGAAKAIERARLRHRGYRVLALGDTENEMINRIIVNTREGHASAEELAFLRQRIAAAEARGKDYFDELARTGSMTAEEPFQLLANAAEIERLRTVAGRNDVVSRTPRAGSGAGPSPAGQQGGALSPRGNDTSLIETRAIRGPETGVGTERIPLEMPPSAEAEMRRRLGPLGPLPLQHALQTAGAMQRLGVPEELARELVAQNAVRLANPGKKQSLNRVIQAQLIARGILEHGTRRIPLEEFAQETGIPEALAEVAAEVAATRGGFAPLPSEIRPGWLYPPYR